MVYDRLHPQVWGAYSTGEMNVSIVPHDPVLVNLKRSGMQSVTVNTCMHVQHDSNIRPLT